MSACVCVYVRPVLSSVHPFIKLLDGRGKKWKEVERETVQDLASPS